MATNPIPEDVAVTPSVTVLAPVAVAAAAGSTPPPVQSALVARASTAVTTKAPPARKSKGQPYFYRLLPQITRPTWQNADAWRQFVRGLPFAMICRDAIINRTVSLPFVVRARPPFDEALYEDEIAYYLDVLQNIDGETFDVWAERMLQDMFDLPVGGCSEIVRWQPGYVPFKTTDVGKRHYETRGLPYEVHHVDGAEWVATGNPEVPLRQVPMGHPVNPISFTQDAVTRAYMLPRVETLRRGYGMAPPETVYFALMLLARGDTYYANLLVDTPEAGVLDMGDMEQETAEDWAASARELLLGTDAFKVMVSYESTSGIKFVPFGRPPSELLYDKTTQRYAQIVSGGYGITIGDIGFDTGGNSLGGQIRGDRSSARNGFAVAKAKLSRAIESRVLPPYLMFVWIDRDEDLTIARGRARLANAQAAKALVQKPVMLPTEFRAQMMADGVWSELDLTLSDEDLAPEPEPEPTDEDMVRGDFDDTRDTMGSTPPKTVADGGHSEIKRSETNGRSPISYLRNVGLPVHFQRLLNQLGTHDDYDFSLPLTTLSGAAWWSAAAQDVRESVLVLGAFDEAYKVVKELIVEFLYERGAIDSLNALDVIVVSPGPEELNGFWDYWDNIVAGELKDLIRSEAIMTLDYPAWTLSGDKWPTVLEMLERRFETYLNEWAVNAATRVLWRELGVEASLSAPERIEAFIKIHLAEETATND